MSEAIVSSEKARLRAFALGRRDACDAKTRADRSQEIADRGKILLAKHCPKVLAAYWPIGSECDPLPLADLARRMGAAIALPVVQDRDLLFRQWDEGAALLPAQFATKVPPSSAPFLVPDAVLVPLAAFDRKGMRIGYGKGYYDRAIAALNAGGHRPLLIGLAFACQEVASVPAESHDVRLNFLLTEAELITFSN